VFDIVARVGVGTVGVQDAVDVHEQERSALRAAPSHNPKVRRFRRYRHWLQRGRVGWSVYSG
jgi:hypothetical protein